MTQPGSSLWHQLEEPVEQAPLEQGTPLSPWWKEQVSSGGLMVATGCITRRVL